MISPFFNLLCTKSFKQGLTEREGRIGIFFIGRDRGSTMVVQKRTGANITY